MSVLRISITAGSLLLLAACAGPSADESKSAAPVTAVPAALPAPNATWIITDLYDPGQLDSSIIGQTVQLTDKLAGDAQGRTCMNPSYQPVQTGSAEALGRPDDVSWNHPVQGFEVWCGSVPFGLYIQARDGSYLSRQADAIMRFALTTGEAPPPAPNMTMAPIFAAMDKMPMEKAPAEKETGHNHMAEKPAIMGKATKSAPTSRSSTVYVASYPSRAKAEQDWKRIQKQHPHLAQAHAEYSAVNLGKKGKFIRLFASAPTDAASLCSPLKRAFPDCGAGWAKK